MAVDWTKFENNINDYIENSKIDDYSKFSNKIADEYHAAILNAENIYGAKPMVVNRVLLNDRIRMALNLILNILSIPIFTIPLPKLGILPKLPNFPVPSIGIIPNINTNFGILTNNINIPVPTFGELPVIPIIRIPQFPKITFPEIGIPIPGLNINLPRIPNITLGTLPNINIDSISIPDFNIPEINIPNMDIEKAKAKVVFALGLKMGISQYWTNGKLSNTIVPGTTTVINNSVVSQLPFENVVTFKDNDPKELSRKITIAARHHLKSITGLTTGITPNGNTILINWKGLT